MGPGKPGRPKGGPKFGGRKKGVPNKVSGDLRAMILSALDRAGGADYLVQQASENAGAFMALVGKVLPKDINATVEGQLQIQFLNEFRD